MIPEGDEKEVWAAIGLSARFRGLFPPFKRIYANGPLLSEGLNKPLLACSDDLG